MTSQTEGKRNNIFCRLCTIEELFCRSAHGKNVLYNMVGCRNIKLREDRKNGLVFTLFFYILHL